jgi:hypothetical protein
MKVPNLLFNKHTGKLEDITEEIVKPDFTMDGPLVHDELVSRITWMGRKVENLIIKRFSGLTIDKLNAYLDNLEIVHGFIPDMILLDYIGLMKLNTKDFRLSLGQVMKDFRDLCIERHVAGVTAQQASKMGATGKSIGLGHVAEDWSLTNTADMVLTYSTTDMEFRYGLGRLYVAKARDEADKFGVLLTQNYKGGQFMLDSTFLGPKYWELIQEMREASGNDDEEDNDDDIE